MTNETEKEQKPDENSEDNVTDENEEEEENLWFTNARVVRLIRSENEGKIIKRRVKIEMNKLLEQIGRIISKELAKKPYSTITYTDFLEAAKPYMELGKINQERRRIIATLNKISEDCKFVAADLEEKTQEADFFVSGE